MEEIKILEQAKLVANMDSLTKKEKLYILKMLESKHVDMGGYYK